MEAKGGYLVADNWMALVMAGYSHDEDVDDKFAVGVGGRYYIIQNGLYMGLNARLVHGGTDTTTSCRDWSSDTHSSSERA